MRMTILKGQFGKVAICPANPSLVIVDKKDFVSVSLKDAFYEVNKTFDDMVQQLNDDMKA